MTSRTMKMGMGLIFTTFPMVSGLVGCATHTGSGALAGGALGAATGAIIGGHSGKAGKGALIGSGIGALAGGLIGNDQDRHEQNVARAVSASTATPVGRPMTLAEVVQMSQSGVSESVIISSIRSSNTSFQLTPTEIVGLHQQGVSDRVIQAMMDNRPSPAPVVVSPRPVVYHHAPPVYVVEPPPPAVRFGIGYHAGPRCRRW